MNYKLKKISGDASFREFYRLQKGKNTSIIVQANKEKFKNLITYIVVNKILAKYKIYAPKLISNHYEHNIIEITDLGQKSFYNSIIKKKNKFKDYKDLIKIIEWPQLINIPLSDKLEIYIDYAKNEKEREVKFVGSGKWKILNEL